MKIIKQNHFFLKYKNAEVSFKWFQGKIVGYLSTEKLNYLILEVDDIEDGVSYGYLNEIMLMTTNYSLNEFIGKQNKYFNFIGDEEFDKIEFK